MINTVSILAGIFLLGHLCLKAWSEQEFSPDGAGTESVNETKNEIQSYIDLVRKNDCEDRENAYDKPRRTKKTPGWKSR